MPLSVTSTGILNRWTMWSDTEEDKPWETLVYRTSRSFFRVPARGFSTPEDAQLQCAEEEPFYSAPYSSERLLILHLSTVTLNANQWESMQYFLSTAEYLLIPPQLSGHRNSYHLFILLLDSWYDACNLNINAELWLAASPSDCILHGNCDSHSHSVVTLGSVQI